MDEARLGKMLVPYSKIVVIRPLLVSIYESIQNWDTNLEIFYRNIDLVMQREESQRLMRKIVDIKHGRSGLMQGVDAAGYNIFDSVLGEATGFFIHLNEFFDEDVEKEYFDVEIINDRQDYVYSFKTRATCMNMGTTLRPIVGRDNQFFQIGSNKLMAMMKARFHIDFVIFKTELNEQQIIPAFI